MSEPVIVVEYDPNWPHVFRRLRARVQRALRDRVVRVEHVGSTAVPGLAAKPIIDLDVVVRSADDVRRAIEQLASIGYRHRGDLGIAGREAFDSPSGSPRHHLYLCVEGSDELNRHVRFRDFLRANPALAQAYAELKREAASRYRDDREAYSKAKDAFVAGALALAGAAAPRR